MHKIGKQTQKQMKPLILLVDDKPEIAKIISMYLSDTFRTQYCANGMVALKMIQQGELPALVVTDVNMPQMDGYEFLVAIKADDSFKHIPVIVLSSIESSSDRIRLLEMGAADYMLKPFNPEELKVRIKNALR